MNKDNLENMIDAGCIDEADRDEILKNQEKAEKWDNNTIEYCVEMKRIVERLKKLPFGLILQHIRDSFSTDKQFMSDNAKIQTEKCIEDLMELQKILVKKNE